MSWKCNQHFHVHNRVNEEIHYSNIPIDRYIHEENAFVRVTNVINIKWISRLPAKFLNMYMFAKMRAWEHRNSSRNRSNFSKHM